MASILHHNSGVLIPRADFEELTEAMATVFRIGARFTPRLIERLDLIDGDCDFENNGTEDDPLSPASYYGPGCPISDPDGQRDEDDLNTHLGYVRIGAGCEISDPGGCEHDGREPESES